jgi:2-oxoisovalerate dehydrogenase E1 component alpha subunit
MLEPFVSRLYGHSSSSGALRVKSEEDCIATFEQKLLENNLLSPAERHRIHQEAQEETDAAALEAVREPKPSIEDVEKFTYAPSPVDRVYPGDYTGLP